ncbi:MAG: hypothetical protein ACLFML_02610 [Desulfobacterales bacterium]
MKKLMKYAAVFMLLFSAAAGAHAFIPDQTINRYLYCEDMVVRTPFIHRVKDPRLEGVLVNRTVKDLRVDLKLRFYNVFSEMLEEVSISADLPPEGKKPFRKTLSNREEIDRIRKPYRLEWEVTYLEADGEQVEPR